MTMNVSMTGRTEGYEIFLPVITQKTPRFNMVYLETLHATAILTAPTITF